MTAVTAASMIATGVTFAVLMTVMTALHIGNQIAIQQMTVLENVESKKILTK